MAICAGLAASIVAVLMGKATAGLCALRDTIAINIGVDLNLADVALELLLVLDRPVDDSPRRCYEGTPPPFPKPASTAIYLLYCLSRKVSILVPWVTRGY